MPPALSLVMPFQDRRDVDFALDLATAIAMRELRGNPRIPSLYRSGVRYARDVCKAPGIRGACEPFKSPSEVLRTGLGDCDDLAPWRAAELRLGGEDAHARAIESPGIGFHVVVFRQDGRVEDPSARLGMKVSR